MTLLVARTSLSPVGLFIVSVLFLFVIRAMAFDVSELEKLAHEAVRNAFMLSGITEDNAADMMRMDVSSLRKCLRGEGQLQLGIGRLLRLPFSFWLHFSPVLMYLVAKKHASEIAESLGVRIKS